MATLDDHARLPAAADAGGAPSDLADADTDQLCDFMLGWYRDPKRVVVPMPGREYDVRPPRDSWRDLLVATGH